MNSNPVPQHLIEEARREHIVPGAVIRETISHATVTVPHTSQWYVESLKGVRFKAEDRTYGLRSPDMGIWAQVIAPAPGAEQGGYDGLEEDMGCACPHAMRVAILEMSRKLGLPTDAGDANPQYGYGVAWHNGRTVYFEEVWGSAQKLKYIPLHEFLRRLENTKPPVAKIMVGNRKVEFLTDAIRVGNTRDGYTVISNSKVLEIHDRMEAEPIVIDGHKAIITPDKVTVGCTTADKATVKAIVERIKK